MVFCRKLLRNMNHCSLDEGNEQENRRCAQEIEEVDERTEE